MLKGTVRNYLAWTALAVAGGLMAMQARSGERSQGDVGPDTNRDVAGVSRQGSEGVIEVEIDLAIREGPREMRARIATPVPRSARFDGGLTVRARRV